MPAAGYSFADSALDNSFQTNIGTFGVTGVLPRYVAQTQKKTKFAVIRLDISATKDYAAGVSEVIAPLGAKVVAEVPVPATTTDFLPAITQAVSQGAEVIVPALGPAQVAALLTATNDAGYGSQVQMVLVPSQSNLPAITSVQKDVKIFSFAENSVLQAGDPAKATYDAIAQKYNPTKAASDPARLAQSYLTGRAFEEIVKANGPNITRDSLVQAAKTAQFSLLGFAKPLSLSGAPAKFKAVAVSTVAITSAGKIVEPSYAVFS
jgi:ABC-type branched-subunit amino acid transport system substrate-binding protein